MDHSLDTYQSFINSSVTLKLLRARNLPLSISFLYSEFKSVERLEVPYHELLRTLANYLENIQYDSQDDEIISDKILLDYDDKAKRYIDAWIDARYLRNVMDDTTKEPYVLLSKHTEKAFQVFNYLNEKEFVGTESRFKDIFYKLRDIVQNSNPDIEKRLQELKQQQHDIDEQIRRIEIDGYVKSYEDYQIKSRFEELNRLAMDLIGDFKEVEDNFKQITRSIYEKQQFSGLVKGRLVKDAFDAIYALRETDQGKSFYAFWQFMIDDNSQQEFNGLIDELKNIIKERKLEVSITSVVKLKSLLYSAARKVLDKNMLLADKISREIIAREQLENLKTKELISSIRTLAIKQLKNQEGSECGIELSDTPSILLPIEKKLSEKQHEVKYSFNAFNAELSMDDLAELTMMFDKDYIDNARLLDNVNSILRRKGQASLAEVVDEFGITKGLAELLSYISLVIKSDKFFINDEVSERIEFDHADTFEKHKDRVHDTISVENKTLIEQVNKISNDISSHMRAFRLPEREILEYFTDWNSDTYRLNDKPESWTDYVAILDKIEKEEIAQHKVRFKKYLNDEMITKMSDFQAWLDNQESNIYDIIKTLNKSLRRINFTSKPPTYIQLDADKDYSPKVADFRRRMNNWKPNILEFQRTKDEKILEESFIKIKEILEYLTNLDNGRQELLDVRNWIKFKAVERYHDSNDLHRSYTGTGSLAGGESAQLTYTILGSAIAYQFGIHSEGVNRNSFRFICVDEAFSKQDVNKANYLMELCKQLHLQVMIVSPAKMEDVAVVEPHIAGVHFVKRKDNRNSFVYDMPIEQLQTQRSEYLQAVEK